MSFLSLGAEEQTSYFKYPLISGHDLKKLKSCVTNPVSGLIMAFEQRVSLFEDVCDAYNEKLIEAVGDIKNIIWCLVKRLRKKLNVVEDGAGNCIVSVRDIGYKFELNNENEQQ